MRILSAQIPALVALMQNVQAITSALGIFTASSDNPSMFVERYNSTVCPVLYGNMHRGMGRDGGIGHNGACEKKPDIVHRGGVAEGLVWDWDGTRV